MTGYGRAEQHTRNYRLNVELKSVNHRYMDVNVKLPKRFYCFESAIRSVVRDYVQRGKVDIYINFEDYAEIFTTLRYNSSLAKEYLTYCKKMEEEFGIINDIKVSALSRFPEVLYMEESTEDEERIWEILKETIVQACKKFVIAKEIEGKHLAEDILKKLDYILDITYYIEQRAPAILIEYKEKLKIKVKELLENASIDENRITAEVVMYADKVCLDEELVRLQAHIESMKKELLQGGCVGRKLDFIAQELNREANTILSKTGDSEISDYAISLKTEIEKIREQIQNIE